MKGIVVEINSNDAVILTDDGLFTKVRNQNYTVGQAIKIQENRKNYSKWIAGAASMAAAFAVCTIGAYAWFTPTDYVSLDVNPSVEYSLNAFDRILDVKAVNDDGKEILERLDLSNMTIEDAVKATLDQLIADGYLRDDPNGGVVITTSNDKEEEAEQLAAELKLEIQSYLDHQEGITAEVDAEAVAPERVEEARELGVTPGKLNLVDKLQESTTGAISVEEWLTKPVKEINKTIKENRKSEKDKEVSKDKFERQEREHSKDKDRTDAQNMATTGGVRLNDQKPQEKMDRENERMDRGAEKKDNNAPDKEKTQKDNSDHGNGGSSGKSKDKDKDKDKDKEHND